MKKRSAPLLTLLFCLLSANLYAAEKDSPDCSDHPLLPRLPGYYIAACAVSDANFDMEPVKGQPSGTIHVEGKSLAIVYRPQPELKSTPSGPQILSSFEKATKKYAGTRIGMTNTIPVYKLVDGGKETWVAVMADATGGGYAYRIIEKEAMTQTEKAAESDDSLGCRKHVSALFTTIPGYEVCGCGEQEASRDVKLEGKSPVHIQGKLTQLSYCPLDERTAKNTESVARRSLENDIKRQGGTFVGKTAKKVDVYKLNKGGKETWIEVWTDKDGNYNYAITQ